MSEVITIGEPIVTFASTEPDVSLVDALNWHKIMGGAELNVAIGVQRLGHTAEYISQVGEDPLAPMLRKPSPAITLELPMFLTIQITGQHTN